MKNLAPSQTDPNEFVQVVKTLTNYIDFMQLDAAVYVAGYTDPDGIYRSIVTCQSEQGLLSKFANDHTQDDDCAPYITEGECRVCGVVHGDPCPECHARAFHKPTCSEVS